MKVVNIFYTMLKGNIRFVTGGFIAFNFKF